MITDNLPVSATSSFRPRTVLVTGGTKGIGLEIGLAFARLGERVILTYGWGSVAPESVIDHFRSQGLEAPLILQADVANDDDTAALFSTIQTEYGGVDVFVSNVSFANVIRQFSDYSEKGLIKSIEYSAWPLLNYTLNAKKYSGRYPSHILGLSSDGPDRYSFNYDFAAITKAVLETMMRYLNHHLFDAGVRVNVIRTRPIITDALLSTFGPDWASFIADYDYPGTAVDASEIGKCAVMLTSGLMDGVSGQVICADNGFRFADGLQSIYRQYLEQKS